ncbi:MAG: hypothetical protein ABI608_00525 [Rhizomicrobium sp.]
MGRTGGGGNKDYCCKQTCSDQGNHIYPAAREDSFSYYGDGAKMKEFVRLLIEATGEPPP